MRGNASDFYTPADLGLDDTPDDGDDGDWTLYCACGASVSGAGTALPAGWIERDSSRGPYWLCPACVEARRNQGADCACDCAVCISAHGGH